MIVNTFMMKKHVNFISSKENAPKKIVSIDININKILNNNNNNKHHNNNNNNNNNHKKNLLTTITITIIMIKNKINNQNML